MFNFAKKSERILTGIYVIEDVVAKKFGIPIPLESDGLARRQFVDFLAQPNIYPHREEFVMVKVADYCDATATYYPIAKEDRQEVLAVDVAKEVDDVFDTLYKRQFEAKSGAAVGAEPPQAASSHL